MARVTLITIISCAIIACVTAAMTQQDRDTALTDHNAERAVFGLPALIYNLTIEANAQIHADKCVFTHSENSIYGENIFMGTGAYGTMAVADQSWASEKNDWDCQTDSCNLVCGHYTQMVWSASAQIGCGLTDCGGQIGVFIVCQFYPPGNFVGQRPFDSSKCSMASAPKSPTSSQSPTSSNTPTGSKTPIKASSAALVSVTGALSLVTLSML